MRARVVVLAAFLVGCGGGGSGDDGSTPDADGDDDTPDAPAGPNPATEIGFVAGEPLGAGSWILIDDWASDPNTVLALPVTDLGGTPREVFRVSRLWSMGASADGATILFSAWDADQEADFGVTIGDAIQNSFRYDAAARSVSLLARTGDWINVNDECHRPTADGAYVYVCRRYDFKPQGQFLGWRLGRFHVADGAFEFLRPDTPGGPYELGPQEVPGTTRILFELRQRPPATGSTLYTRDVATGAEVVVRAGASRPSIGPEGRVIYHDPADRSRLKEFRLANPGGAAIAVSPTLNSGDAAWAPDGRTVVYSVYDDEHACDHLERVTWSGTAWSAPVRVRDCNQTGEFITDLAWITIP